MFNIWPYLLRLAIAFYFIYPHGKSLTEGINTINDAVFSCIDQYIPSVIAFTVWHSIFVILGVLILVWPRPILPLVFALFILSTQLYIDFATEGSVIMGMLLLILILVTLALIIYHSRPQIRG